MGEYKDYMFRMNEYFKKIKPTLKRVLMLVAYGIIFLAMLSTIFRALTPMVSQYKPRLEHLLSGLVEQPVTIEQLETGWYWFQPIVKAKQVVIKNADQPLLQIAQVELGMSLWRSLLYWRFQPGLLLIDGVTLKIQQTPTNWIIQGIPISNSVSQEKGSAGDLLALVLGHQTLQLKHVELELTLKDNRQFQLKDLSATLVNGMGAHRLRGFAWLQSPKTQLEFGADFLLSSLDPEKISGHAYLKADDFLVPQWVNQYAPADVTLKHARVGGEVWADISQGGLVGLQSRLNITKLVWHDQVLKRTGKLEQLSSHLKWEKNSEGYTIVGKEVELHDSLGAWPATDFVFTADPGKENYQLFVRHLDIARLFALPLRWPVALLPILDMQPTGTFSELRLQKQAQQWTVLTQFTDLGWKKSQKWPKVQHLSGVLSLGADQGQLAIDSPGIRIKFPHQAALKFSVFNARLRWLKELQGVRYQLEHFAVSHPHLKLQAGGQFTQVANEKGDLKGADNIGLIDLNAQFELLDATYWLAYLPKASLKPKLYEWLHDDIYKINSGIGSLNIQGPWKDFPFDQGGGHFKVETQLEGVDLSFARGWPAAKNIKGRLLYEGRRFSAQITEAEIGNARLDGVSLNIDEVGLDREQLLVHGVTKERAQEVWSVLLASPVGKKQAMFSSMDWLGKLGLDLQLDVSLHSGSDEVLVKGEVALDDNTLSLATPLVQLKFEKLNGVLKFDEKGLLTSDLEAKLWKNVIPIKIITEEEPHRQTQIRLNPTATTKTLFEVFNRAPVSWLAGEVNLDVDMMFSSPSQPADILTIKSNLTGLTIDLVPFLKKTAEEEKSLITTIQFDSGSHTQLGLQYDGRQLELNRSFGGVWELHSSLKTLSGRLKYDEQQKLLSGEIDALHLVPGQFNFETSSSSPKLKPRDLPALDVVIKALKYDDWELGRLSLKARKQGRDWSLSSWELMSSVYTVTGKGLWTQQHEEDKSQLEFYFSTNDISKALRAWHVNPLLEAGKAQLQVDVTYPAAFWDMKLKSFVGKVEGKITHGRTMNFNKQTESKIGLGKLISLFSLQTIPRRLQLDFSDLSHDGYSFDEFYGEFKLANGNLETQKCTIEGPVASTDIHGLIDLNDQLYDLTVRIAPQLTGSLPIVATIAGGPVAGVATWLASKIINKGMQQIVSYTYRVTGPWKDPIIEPLKVNRRPFHRSGETITKAPFSIANH